MWRSVTYLVVDIEIVGQGVASRSNGAIVWLQNRVIEVTQVRSSGIKAVGHLDGAEIEISQWKDSTEVWWIKAASKAQTRNLDRESG